MTFPEYQAAALKTAIYPKIPAGVYTNNGLREEVGEICGKFKKLMRDADWLPDMPIPEDKRIHIIKELGDATWYVVNIMAEDHIRFTLTRPEDCQQCAEKYYDRGISVFLDELCTFAHLVTCERSHHSAMRLHCWWMFIYIACIAHLCGSTLDIVFQTNIAKLSDRASRGTLHGSGDNR